MAFAVPSPWNGFLFAGGREFKIKTRKPAIYRRKEMKMKKQLLAAFAGIGLLAHSAGAAITAGGGAAYYSNPHAGTENIASFDWDASGNLYWMGGDANWAQSMNVYKYDGAALTTVDSRASFAGTWLNSHGNNIYFDDGTAYSFNRYDTVNGGAVTQAFQQDNAWGYTFHGNGLFISGADASWNNQLYYSEVDTNGDLTGPLITLGLMGSPSGPVTFDSDGNLFYGAGYSDGKLYKYSAIDVATAIAGTPLGDAALHEFLDFNSFGVAGMTGMDFTNEGNLVASLTAFGSPSQLVEFEIAGDGSYSGNASVWAVSDGRMTTVRNRDGTIYFSDPDAVYAIPEPGTIMLVLLGAGGLVGFRKRFKR
jgi:hypothetical protein